MKINNRQLVTESIVDFTETGIQTKLKRNIRDGLDFVSLPSQVWRALR